MKIQVYMSIYMCVCKHKKYAPLLYSKGCCMCDMHGLVDRVLC